MKTFHSDLIVCVPKKVPPTIFAAARVVSETPMSRHLTFASSPTMSTFFLAILICTFTRSMPLFSSFDICEQPDNVNLFPRHFNMHFYSFYASFLVLSILCFRASRDCAQ